MRAPKECPIIFSGPMVRAILEGRKTQTRRVIKPHYRSDEAGFQVCTNKATGERFIEKYDEGEMGFDSPRYVYSPWQIGDRLWVRETFSEHPQFADIAFRADGEKFEDSDGFLWEPKWRPSIHMPRALSRIMLEVTGVRVERLQSITLEDARAEGFELSQEPEVYDSPLPEHPLRKYAKGFTGYWNILNTKRGYSWDTNPWVWVIEFRRIKP